MFFFIGRAGRSGDCKVVNLLSEKKESEEETDKSEKVPCSQPMFANVPMFAKQTRLFKPMCAKQTHSNLDCSSKVLSTKSVVSNWKYVDMK